MIGLASLLGVVVLAGTFLDPNLFWNFFSGFHALFFEGEDEFGGAVVGEGVGNGRFCLSHIHIHRTDETH